MSNFSVSIGNKQQRNTNKTVLKVRTVKTGSKQGNSSGENNKLYPYQMDNGVTLELSYEAREKLIQAQNMLRNISASKEKSESQKKAVVDIGKIMTIFRRIANGDIVPWQDEKKLMNYSLEMYQIAKAAAVAAKNEEPEEYDSVDEEKEKGGSQAASKSFSGISATVEIPVASVAPADTSAESGGTEE